MPSRVNQWDVWLKKSIMVNVSDLEVTVASMAVKWAEKSLMTLARASAQASRVMACLESWLSTKSMNSSSSRLARGMPGWVANPLLFFKRLGRSRWKKQTKNGCKEKYFSSVAKQATFTSINLKYVKTHYE